MLPYLSRRHRQTHCLGPWVEIHAIEVAWPCLRSCRTRSIFRETVRLCHTLVFSQLGRSVEVFSSICKDHVNKNQFIHIESLLPGSDLCQPSAKSHHSMWLTWLAYLASYKESESAQPAQDTPEARDNLRSCQSLRCLLRFSCCDFEGKSLASLLFAIQHQINQWSVTSCQCYLKRHRIWNVLQCC